MCTSHYSVTHEITAGLGKNATVRPQLVGLCDRESVGLATVELAVKTLQGRMNFVRTQSLYCLYRPTYSQTPTTHASKAKQLHLIVRLKRQNCRVSRPCESDRNRPTPYVSSRQVAPENATCYVKNATWRVKMPRGVSYVARIPRGGGHTVFEL